MYLSRPFEVVSCCFLATAMLFASSAPAQEARPISATQRVAPGVSGRVMTLDATAVEEARGRSMVVSGAGSQRRTAEDIREFEGVSKGQIGDTKTLTLRFAAGAQLLAIKSTPDFKVEQGGSCVEGFTFVANSTCTLLVRSTPQGPGHRVGKLEISNSADVTPLLVGLGGFGYAPTISFTPSVITSVPGTVGTISGSTSLAIDGGDTLYIADTGHNTIDSIDSSGTVVNASAAFGATAPVSVAADRSGYIWFVQRTDPFLTIITSPYSETYYNTGSGTCAVGATCSLGNGPNIYAPSLGQLAIDPNGTIFMNYSSQAFELLNNSGVSALQYIPLVTNGSYNNAYNTSNFPAPLAVDSGDTLYTYYNAGSNKQCTIAGQPFYNAETNTYKKLAVTGTANCGSSGDGGQSQGAEISNRVGQMTFDNAGNFYFTDTLNQKVRRIDNATGIITTIAGNGATGYGGDNGPATNASLNNPTGVTVDSQGQVYVLSNSAATGTAQVVRKVGVIGALNLGNMTVGSPSTPQTVTVSNTGNSQLDFTHVGFSSGNTSDFALDPNTTSCNFTAALAAGRSCKVGFIFTPSVTGSRAAVLSITSDTIAGINTIQLSGAGFTSATLTPASFTFANTSTGSTSATQVATLTNTGKAVMTISSIALSGAGATSYVETTNCGATLAVGASCTVSVAFKPTAAATFAATLTVTDNAVNGHQTVSLTGTGVGVAKAGLSPASLSFASTKVGATSAGQTVTLSNTGTAPFTVTSITMTGTNAADFPMTKTCGASVAAGSSCTITVSFKPTAAGTRTASLSVATSAGSGTVSITGAAAAAAAKSAVTLSSPAPSMAVGRTMIKVHVAGTTAKTPTGSVHLMDGGNMIAQGVLRGGIARFYLPRLSAGLHMMQAIYIGDNWNSGADSDMMAQWVTAAPFQ